MDRLSVTAMADTQKQITNKFENVIDKYRDNHSEESEEPYWGFGSPCQIEIFSMSRPIEFSLLILTHDDKRDDKNIVVHQAKNGSKFLDVLEDKLEAPRWKQVAEREIKHAHVDQATKTQFDISTRGDLLINSFQNHLVNTGSDLLFSDTFGTRQASRISDKIWCYFIYGDIKECELDELFPLVFADLEDDEDEMSKGHDEDDSQEDIDSSSDSADLDSPAESKPNESSSEREEVKRYGTFFHEPVWVGDIPDPDFRDRILGQMSYDRDTVMNREFDGYSVQITQDGLVVVNDIDDKKEALDIINTIFGASIFHGYTFQAATQNDLMEVEIENGEISNVVGSPNLPRKISNINHVTKHKAIHNSDYRNERTIIEIEKMETILDYSKKIYAEEKLGERTHIALQAYTHYQNGEYTQAFLLSWISVEQYINTYVYDHLTEDANISNTRAGNIIDSSNWSASNKIEVLEILMQLVKADIIK